MLELAVMVLKPHVAIATDSENTIYKLVHKSHLWPTLRDSLKAAKLLFVSTVLSRLRDLLLCRGTPREVSDVSPLSPSGVSHDCSSITISRLVRGIFWPMHGKDLLLDASIYLASSTLDLKLTKANQSIWQVTTTFQRGINRSRK